MRRMHGICAATICFWVVFLGGCQTAPTPPATTSNAPVATSPAAQVPTTVEAPTAPQTATAAPLPTTAPDAAKNSHCLFEPIDLGTYGGAQFRNPDVITSGPDHVLRATLDVRYAQNTIAGCPVNLRSYNGKLVGDTWLVHPGDTLEITLTNSLPTVDISSDPASNYNVTNLHTHGLHTSPGGSDTDGWGDNVLLRVWPKGQQLPSTHDHGDLMVDRVGQVRYKIEIPKDHPTGTFWYHAHAHEATAVQVSSGMAGALIIEDDNSGLDKLPEIKAAAAREKIFMLQQNVYDEKGVIEDPNYGNFGPCTWEPTYREHLINGQLYPTITMTVGMMERWRFIHAGIRETVSLQLRGPDPTIASAAALTSATRLFTPLTLPSNDLNEVAVDGLALGKIDRWQDVELNPGYRSDVLVKIDKPGTYYLIDGLSSAQALTCPNHIEQPSALAKVVVMPRPSGATDTQASKLPTADELKQAKVAFQDIVRMDLTQTPGSETFLQPITSISTFQQTEFTVAAHPITATNSISYTNIPVVFIAGDRSFSSDHVRTVTLGNTDLWMLQTKSDSLYYAHPFHIHINPFQTWRNDPHGNPELVWRDTLLVPQGQTQYIYTNYKKDTEASSGFKDFSTTGTFVYHCHILDHEDQGMMEAVEIKAR